MSAGHARLIEQIEILLMYFDPKVSSYQGEPITTLRRVLREAADALAGQEPAPYGEAVATIRDVATAAGWDGTTDLTKWVVKKLALAGQEEAPQQDELAKLRQQVVELIDTNERLKAAYINCRKFASAKAEEPPRWQPIETAPKDETWFWVRRTVPHHKTTDVTAFRWDAAYGGWYSGFGWWPTWPPSITSEWRRIADQPSDAYSPAPVRHASIPSIAEQLQEAAQWVTNALNGDTRGLPSAEARLKRLASELSQQPERKD